MHSNFFFSGPLGIQWLKLINNLIQFLNLEICNKSILEVPITITWNFDCNNYIFVTNYYNHRMTNAHKINVHKTRMLTKNNASCHRHYITNDDICSMSWSHKLHLAQHTSTRLTQNIDMSRSGGLRNDGAINNVSNT